MGSNMRHAKEQLRSLRGLDALRVLQDGTAAAACASSVESVEVTQASLAYFPPLLTVLTNLSKLDLSSNMLTYIPFSISTMTRLTHLSVSRNNLRHLPLEIARPTALRTLDASHNELLSLPSALCTLTHLEVCNVMGNQLTELPTDFGHLCSLRLLGLKSNRLESLPSSFSALTSLVELFVTDNRIKAFPEGLGQLKSLVKLQASFNSFESIPEELSLLPRLEMMRVAVCNISDLPPSLGACSASDPASAGPQSQAWSSLAWSSLGGNPVASRMPPPRHGLVEVTSDQLRTREKLGDGASGEVMRAFWNGKEVAVKFFRADVSPDGRTMEEVAIACAVDHPHLTKVLAIIPSDNASESGSTAATPSALAMELCTGVPLAAKPTSAHLLRCKWAADKTLSPAFALKVATDVCSALAYLHSPQLRVCHGDVYAHNILVDSLGHATLCDFGASFCYDDGAFWERMEVRAYGIFLTDLIQQAERQEEPRHTLPDHRPPTAALQRLVSVRDQCLNAPPALRPGFLELLGQLQAATS